MALCGIQRLKFLGIIQKNEIRVDNMYGSCGIGMTISMQFKYKLMWILGGLGDV